MAEPAMKFTLRDVRNELSGKLDQMADKHEKSNLAVMASLEGIRKDFKEYQAKTDREIGGLKSFRSWARGAMAIGGAIIGLAFTIIGLIISGKK